MGVPLGTKPVPDWKQRYAYDAYGNRTLSKAFGPKKFVCTDPSDPSDPFSGNCRFSRPELPSDSRDGLDGITYRPYTNRITTEGYGYDAEGNLVRAQRADGTWQRYNYDAAGRLAGITDDIGNLRERHIYGEGRRRLGTEKSESGRFFRERTYYAWSGDHILGEYVERTILQRPPIREIIDSKSYVYLGERLLAKLVLNGSREELNFHHPGRLDTRITTDANGNTRVNHEPYSFGTEDLSISIQDDTRRFTSYDRSTVTGLDYAVNRYYDPLQGRFTQPDPIGIGAVNLGNPQTLNMYAYVANDPVNTVDPSGLLDDECKGLADGTNVSGGFVCSGGKSFCDNESCRFEAVEIETGDCVGECTFTEGEVIEGETGDVSLTGGKGLLPGSTGWGGGRGVGASSEGRGVGGVGASGEGGGVDASGGGGWWSRFPLLPSHPWFKTNQAKIVKELMDLLRSVTGESPIQRLPKPPPPSHVRKLPPIQGPPPPPEKWKLWEPSFPLIIINPDWIRDPCSIRNWTEACGPS